MENFLKPDKEIKREEINESFELVDINNIHLKNLQQVERNSKRGKDDSNEKAKKNKQGPIPFISKSQGKDDRTVSNKSDKNCNSSDTESIDEIDHLINKIGSRSKVKIEDKTNAKLDFDEDNLKSDKLTKNSKPAKEKNKNMKLDQILLKKPQTQAKSNTESRINNTNNSLGTNITNNSNSQNNTVITNKTNPKKNSKKEILPVHTERDKIIDPLIVNQKQIISNSDLLLTIFEICLFSKEYGFKYKTKSKVFWEDICKKENFKNIFSNYKPDTLKKYWCLLSDVKDHQKVIELIRLYKDLIDYEDLKILTLISNLVDCIKNKKENFEIILTKMCKSNNKTQNFLGNKRKSEVELNKIGVVDLEKGLHKEDDLINYENIKLDELFRDENNLTSKQKDCQIVRNRVVIPNEKDKSLFNDIDNILTVLKIHFPEMENQDVLEILKSTSFNIANAFIYLKDTKMNKKLLFTDMEDYIIKNMRKTDYYNELLRNKGKDLVEEREKFLQIEED